jgi:hypothetical protein
MRIRLQRSEKWWAGYGSDSTMKEAKIFETMNKLTQKLHLKWGSSFQIVENFSFVDTNLFVLDPDLTWLLKSFGSGAGSNLKYLRLLFIKSFNWLLKPQLLKKIVF